MNAQHTALPWFARETTIWSNKRIDERIKVVANTITGHSNDEDLSNAAFIVRACNAHADLTNALQAIVAELTGPLPPYSADSHLPPHLLAAAVAALSKASA